MQPGTQLNHYTVLEAIGKGGMGEVWKAKDTKLGREVAIKTLPAEFAQDADRLARFEREAKLLAQPPPLKRSSLAKPSRRWNRWRWGPAPYVRATTAGRN